MRCKRRSRTTLTTSTILSVAFLLLAGCATTPGLGPDEGQRLAAIPDPPSYLKPAAVPPANPGDSWPEVAEKRKQVIEHQNTVIVSGRRDWAAMKKRLGQPLSRAR